MVRLQEKPIDHAALTESVRGPSCGAVCLFLGTVRELTEGKRTLALAYEAYPRMAEQEMEKIEAEARRRWPLSAFALVHRLGKLELGEVAVAVAVGAPHRAEAFEACRFAIDQAKATVPIWKQENWADGTTEWVHPA